ncbi:hypothetical protein EYR36_006882 [Pleurotus pulmonarius]|nr:hypothetical protein EYR36_006882 [Pleurotus pulmonarius]
MYWTVKSLPSILVRPLRRLALGSTTVDNGASDGVSHPHSTSCIHYHNATHGHGIFNNVHGNKDTHMRIVFNLNDTPPISNDVPSVIEPHQSAIRSLFDILLALRKLHETPSVLALQQQVKTFIPIVACVAKAVETVRRISPRFATHTLFFEIDNQALQYESGIARMAPTLAGRVRWPAAEPAPWWLIDRSTDFPLPVLDGAVRDWGTHTESWGISRRQETIWIQVPTGPAMYAVPLSFCTSWRDITRVVHQYFQAGPERHCICLGDWEMVHVDDNRVLEERSFADALKPEAVFDIGIGIIVSRCLTQSRKLYRAVAAKSKPPESPKSIRKTLHRGPQLIFRRVSLIRLRRYQRVVLFLRQHLTERGRQ